MNKKIKIFDLNILLNVKLKVAKLSLLYYKIIYANHTGLIINLSKLCMNLNFELN